MSLNVTLNGSVYIIPETGEVGWGGNTTSYLVAIAAGVLQKTGGSFTLSAEADFGASFGLKSLYYKSRSTNISSTGILRLNNNSDAISWRNFANNGDLPLIADTSDRLLYNGNPVLTGTTPSAYVSSITGTANQIIASASTGPVTLSLPQSLATNSALQFGTLGLGSSIVASSILSLTSTTLGFLPPRMTTAERDLISSPATGLFIYNTSTDVNNYYNGVSWVAIAAGGTINAGTQFQLAYYAANGTTLSGLTLITASRALASDVNGLPVASTTTAAELGFVAGVTSAVQTQLNLKAPLASPIFTGTVTIPSPFTLGATSVTASGTEMNYLIGVTSAIQTQLNTKATDTLVVHLAGNETITGEKTFNDTTLKLKETTGSEVITISVPTLASNRVVRFPDAGQNSDIVLTEGAQTINGNKTVSALIGTLAADLTANTHKITGLSAGTNAGDSVRFEQLFYGFQAPVQGTTTSPTSTTSSTYAATGLTASITPTSSTHRIKITVNAGMLRNTASSTANAYLTIFRDSTNLGVANGMTGISSGAVASIDMPASMSWVDSPGDTNSHTYTVYVKNTNNSTSVSFNVQSQTTSIILEEIV